MEIPKKIRDKIENVAIIVEDTPPTNFLGLYHGVPFPKRKTPSYSLVLPDRIIIYKKSIENYCQTEEEIENMIEKVLLHEIGHYLGLDEKSLKKFGL